MKKGHSKVSKNDPVCICEEAWCSLVCQMKAGVACVKVRGIV